MNFTCSCFRLNVATGRSRVTHGACVLFLLDNAVLPNRSWGCQVLTVNAHSSLQDFASSQAAEGMSLAREIFFRSLPASAVPSTRRPITPGPDHLHTGLGSLKCGRCLPLTQQEPCGLYFYILQGKMCPREGKQLTDKGREWTSACPRLLSAGSSPRPQSKGVGTPLWGSSETVHKF